MAYKRLLKLSAIRILVCLGPLFMSLIGAVALGQVVGRDSRSAEPMVLQSQISSLTSNTSLLMSVVTYSTGGYQASMVAVADVNGDMKPDLIVINCGGCYGPPVIGHAGSIGVMLGNGDGTFQPAVTYNSGTVTPIFVAVADVNADSKLDLVVANKCGNNGCLSEDVVSVLLGNGDGTFRTAQNFGSGGMFSFSVAVADVNGDRKPDILAGNKCINSNCDGAIGVLLGNGDGSFQMVVPYLTGGSGSSGIAVADVNGDGRPDALALTSVPVCNPQSCYYISAVSVLLGNGGGTFQPAVTYPSGGYLNGVGSLAIADLNGDGMPDVVVENSQCCGSPFGVTGVLLGNGNGTFKPVVIYKSTAGGWGSSAAVADMNRDGKVDLVVTDQDAAANGLNNGVVSVFLGNGDGTFQVASTYDAGGFLTNWAAVEDVNGDGAPDVIVANWCADDTTYCKQTSVGVLLNNPGGLETTPPIITGYPYPKILRPANGNMVPVTVRGTIVDSGSGVNPASASFAVQDEYRLVQPQGKIALDVMGNYMFTIRLQASRNANDFNGRHYTIRISASDKVGNRAAKAMGITVPYY
jgi:hypothetical protein